MKLAVKETVLADRARDDVERPLQAYKAEVGIKGKDASPAKVEAAIVKLSGESAAIKQNLLGAFTKITAGEVTPVIHIDGAKKLR